MKKLAIISSYREACGIANYTERLEPVFKNYYDVSVLKLETKVLRGNDAESISVGNAMIKEIAEQLKDFDCVNIQFEAGLFGTSVSIVKKRIKMILNNCKNLIVTFHSVNFNSQNFRIGMLISRHLVSNIRAYRNSKRWPAFYDWFVKELKMIDKNPDRKASIVVHDNVSKLFISRAYNFKYVYAHPLTLSSAAERVLCKTEQEKRSFNDYYGIKNNEKTIGIFGFISEYKGHMVALKALRHLPYEYKLLIFGGQHPNSVEPYVLVDKYLGELLDYIEKCDAEDQKYKQNGNMNKSENASQLFSQRVKFVGTVSNDDFAMAMRCCDFVVLPYAEVNQMGSGIATLAIENHAKSILSNTNCFRNLQEFFPNCFSTFDIGNYMQLVYNIEHFKDNYYEAIDYALENYNLEANIKRYVEIFNRGKNDAY